MQTLVSWVEVTFGGLLESISMSLQIMPPVQPPVKEMIASAANILRNTEGDPQTALGLLQAFVVGECAKNGKSTEGIAGLIGFVSAKAQPVALASIVSSPAATAPTPTPTPIVTEKPASKPTVSQVPSGTIIGQQPVMAKNQTVSSAPARVLASGDFAGKLAQATANIGMGPLGEFWKLLENRGEGLIYWDSLRRSLDKVLSSKLIQSDEDWKRFLAVYRHNAFSTTKEVVKALCEQMPKEIMRDLLFEGQDCFLVKIRHLFGVRQYFDSAPFFVSMVLELTLVSDGPEEDVRLLVALCERVVGRMMEGDTIAGNHFLVKRIKALKSLRKAIPDSKYASQVDVREVEENLSVPGFHEHTTAACQKVNGVLAPPAGTQPTVQVQ